MKDSIGDRMKHSYEIRTKTHLPRRTYTVIRLDGRSFKNYTRGCERPFDLGLMEDMNKTAEYLCKEIQGAQFAYVQSDEISILITDFKKLTSSAWFDGEVQKIVSVSASMAAAKFNRLRLKRQIEKSIKQFERVENDESLQIKYDLKGLVACDLESRLAAFDARVFSIPDPFEVHNYFVWRQQDATRNSISMGAQSLYSHKELHGKSTSDMQDMMHEKGVNWNDYPVRFKRGGFVLKQTIVEEVPGVPVAATRHKWATIDPPIFTQETEFTFSRIPVITGADEVVTLQDLANVPAF